MPLSLIDFFNSREQATILFALVLFAAIKTDGLGNSFASILPNPIQIEASTDLASAALYCAGLVYVGKQLGLWHGTAVKETVYWFFGVGVVLVGDALVRRPEFKKVGRRALRFTIFVEFLVNLYVLPFVAEFFLVPLLAIRDPRPPHVQGGTSGCQ
jgi:hypothetical protein